MRLRTFSVRDKLQSVEALLGGILVLAIIMIQAQFAFAATLTTASVAVSDPRPSLPSTTYTFTGSGVTTTAIKCMRIEFDTLSDGTGSKPNNMTLTGALLSATSNYIPTPASWSPSVNNATGVISITFGTGEAPASASARTIVLTGITNGDTVNTSYFMLVNTYNNTDCATSPVDSSSVGFIYTTGQAVTIGVDSVLTFAVAGVAGTGVNTVNSATLTNGLTTTSSTIPFGTVSSSANKIAAQDLTVSTNSGNGYTVYTRYTAKPTSGAFNIDDLATATNAVPTAFSAAGIEAFGYTTEDSTLSGTAARFTSSGGNKWAPFTTTNAELVFSAAAVNNQTTRVGFQTGIANTTEPGSYTTSVIYTATPVY